MFATLSVPMSEEGSKDCGRIEVDARRHNNG